MLQDLGANATMLAEAMEKANDTPGFQKINRILGKLWDKGRNSHFILEFTSEVGIFQNKLFRT
jgi:hypothetical protein